jgi:hypothetical protein
MKRHQSCESSDLIGLQRQGDVAPWDGIVEFQGNVSMPGSQPCCQELPVRDIAVKDDAKGWRSAKSWDALRVDKSLGSSVRGAKLWIRSE